MADTPRIQSLDGLRALSIAMVVLSHSVQSRGLWAAYAHAGVLIFFVISGYLITTLMLGEMSATGRLNVKQFYIRRVTRIFPVAYAYLTFVTIWQHASLPWRYILMSWTYLTSYAWHFGTVPWSLAALWSLSVEEQFYLLWPLVIVTGLICARRAAWGAVLTAPIVRYWCVHHAGFENMAEYSFPAVMDSIATGCLCALLVARRGLVQNARLGLTAWFIAFSCPLLQNVGSWHGFPVAPQLAQHARWTMFNFAVGIGMLWAISAAPRILNNSVAVWIGKLSYSLYLWHIPFMNPRWHVPMLWRILPALAAASVSFYVIEKPMLRLTRMPWKKTISIVKTV